MDLNTLKDMNNLKTIVKGIGEDIKEAFAKVKDVDVEKFKNGFNTYVVDYLKNNYAKFDGRVSRRQYWMFALYSSLVGIALSILIMILPFLGIFSWVYLLAILVPSVSLVVCRLHDINLSGWFFLICLIPFLGFLALVFLLCLPGDKGDNKFGAEVK